MPRPTSRKQARFFGANFAARGVKWAKNSLRGVKMKSLPARSKGGKKKK